MEYFFGWNVKNEVIEMAVYFHFKPKNRKMAVYCHFFNGGLNVLRANVFSEFIFEKSICLDNYLKGRYINYGNDSKQGGEPK